LDPASGVTGSLTQAFAAGALLSMGTDTLLPESYVVVGILTGVLVVIGFAGSSSTHCEPRRSEVPTLEV
jgi:ZIP family zinc transporter